MRDSAGSATAPAASCRKCLRCERVYHKSSVPETCECGASLAETNRVITHLEQILAKTPEVEGTSRRTGLQLGLAQVTEANTGDISVKLRPDRKRSTDEVISDVRARIKKAEPTVDPDFPEMLQDQIGDFPALDCTPRLQLAEKNGRITRGRLQRLQQFKRAGF